jgi:CRISPR-associated protein Cas1
VHTGNARSFVFDVADLYKMELAVPVAFSVTATSESEDIPGEVRRKMRDAIHESKLLSRCARDLRRLLLEDEAEGLETTADELHLWDDRRGRVAGGKDYAEDDVPW